MKEEGRKLESGTSVSHVEVDRRTGCPISFKITFFVLIRRAVKRKRPNSEKNPRIRTIRVNTFPLNRQKRGKCSAVRHSSQIFIPVFIYICVFPDRIDF